MAVGVVPRSMLLYSDRRPGCTVPNSTRTGRGEGADDDDDDGPSLSDKPGQRCVLSFVLLTCRKFPPCTSRSTPPFLL